MRPCGSVRHHRGTRRTATKPITEAKIIYPNESTITLTRDGQVKVGNHVIGQWTKNEVCEGGFHFRPVYSGHGRASYTTRIPGKEPVVCYRKKEMYKEIARVCKDGIRFSE